MRKLLVILILVFITACVQQQPVKELTFPGHGSQIYTFRNDINEALKVPVNNPAGIRELFLGSEKINIIFDGSNESENALYRVVLIDLGKIPVFFSYERKLIKFDYFYSVNGQWYDAENKNITELPSGPSLQLIGPNSKPKTEVELINETIYLKGKSFSDLTLSGDRLTLAVFGVEKI